MGAVAGPAAVAEGSSKENEVQRWEDLGDLLAAAAQGVLPPAAESALAGAGQVVKCNSFCCAL
jgi:hypothetical protein